jgi:hypothetical protein
MHCCGEWYGIEKDEVLKELNEILVPLKKKVDTIKNLVQKIN